MKVIKSVRANQTISFYDDTNEHSENNKLNMLKIEFLLPGLKRDKVILSQLKLT